MKTPEVSAELIATLLDNGLCEDYRDLLMSLDIDFPEDASDEYLEKISNEIINKYKLYDSELNDYNLYKGYDTTNIYFIYDDLLWCCEYSRSEYNGWHDCDEPYCVEPYEETVTKYRRI